MAVAVAHPNIALVKYWGKRPGRGNVPATPSLSITLDGLTTRTSVDAAAEDTLEINGEQRRDAKVAGLVAALREEFSLPPLRIASCGNFPVGAGLASSASGFAALVTAVNETFSLGLPAGVRGTWARRGSASAARSVFGGFVALDPDAGASRVLDRDEWPLEVVVAVTSDAAKAVSSTDGMERSRATSPFYGAWLQSTATDFDDGVSRNPSSRFRSLGGHRGAQLPETACPDALDAARVAVLERGHGRWDRGGSGAAPDGHARVLHD